MKSAKMKPDSFTRQAALQLAFNNWSDDVGFRDEARNQEVASLVSEKGNTSALAAYHEHLMLSAAALLMILYAGTQSNTEWADLLPNFMASSAASNAFGS